MVNMALNWAETQVAQWWYAIVSTTQHHHTQSSMNNSKTYNSRLRIQYSKFCAVVKHGISGLVSYQNHIEASHNYPGVCDGESFTFYSLVQAVFLYECDAGYLWYSFDAELHSMSDLKPCYRWKEHTYQVRQRNLCDNNTSIFCSQYSHLPVL